MPSSWFKTTLFAPSSNSSNNTHEDTSGAQVNVNSSSIDVQEAVATQEFNNLSVPTSAHAQAAISNKIHEELTDESKLGRRLMLSSICASAVSNIAGIAVGHPLDTLRVSIIS